MKALISVIMPVYQARPYVEAAILSALGQDYRPLEIVCVDDGSTDGSLAMLESFGEQIRILTHVTNQGIAAARNTGLAAARGELISFLDADDLWKPEKLSLQAAYLTAHPDVQMVFGHMRCFLSPDLSQAESRRRICPAAPLPGIVAGTAVIRREILERTGEFDRRLKVGEFMDWLARAQSAGCETAVMPDVFLERRIHGSNSVLDAAAVRRDYLRIVKAALDRRRALG